VADLFHARCFFEAVAERIAQTAHLRHRANDDRRFCVVEFSQPGKQPLSQNVCISPCSPAKDLRCCACIPAVGQHYADRRVPIAGFVDCCNQRALQSPAVSRDCLFLFNAAHQYKPSARCVVAQTNSGRGKHFTGLARLWRNIVSNPAYVVEGIEQAVVDSSGPIDHNPIFCNFQHGGFDAYAGRAAVEHCVDAAVQIRQHVRRCGWAGVAEAVGAGCGDGNTRLSNQFQSHRMRRHARTDQRASGGNSIGNGLLARKQQGQRTGPEGLDQLIHNASLVARGKLGDLRQHLRPVDVDDQRIPAWASLGDKDLRDSGRIERIRTQAVDRLGGEGNRASGAQDRCGAGQIGRRFGLETLRLPQERLRLWGRQLVMDQNKILTSSSYRSSPYTFEMQTAEIELKFPIPDLARFQTSLPALGFHLDTPRTFEQNTLYDTADRSLRLGKQILRLRQYGDLWTLTHKRPADSPADGDSTRYKIRIETETHLDDGPALAVVFHHMGYDPVFRYEKFRTEWSYASPTIEGPLFSGTLFNDSALPSDLAIARHLVIDETPIGNYAELEGPPEWIDRTLEQLGVDPATCLIDSYGKLFLDWKQRTGSDAEHLTFDQIDATELLQPALR